MTCSVLSVFLRHGFDSALIPSKGHSLRSADPWLLIFRIYMNDSEPAITVSVAQASGWAADRRRSRNGGTCDDR